MKKTAEKPGLETPVKKAKLTKQQIIMITGFSLVIITIIIVGIILYQLLNKKPDANGNLVINDSNLSTIGEQLEEQVQDGMYEVNMNTNWNFRNSKSASSNASVANSTSNRYPVSFDIILEGQEEAIYSSDVIPVGYSIKEIKLDTELPAGTYNGICKYHLLNEDGSEKSSLSVTITIIIEE